ncbi:hypothetical protein RCO48_05835 [Peribacillus frigoritolerans]|nr:hypothetical protein [Peribacillus frigoritolerans]
MAPAVCLESSAAASADKDGGICGDCLNGAGGLLPPSTIGWRKTGSGLTISIWEHRFHLLRYYMLV